MAEAEYEIPIPQTGRDIAHHTARYISEHFSPEGHKPVTVHIDRSREMYMHGRSGLHDVVTVRGEDSPYTDSFVKQTAVYAGQVALVPQVTVSKRAKGGVQAWTLNV